MNFSLKIHFVGNSYHFVDAGYHFVDCPLFLYFIGIFVYTFAALIVISKLKIKKI